MRERPTPCTFYIIYISLRAGLHLDKICSWLLLSVNETYKNCKGDLMRLDTPAWGPLVHEWAESLLAVKQNQHFLSHSQCQWTFLRHWQGLSLLRSLWWAQAPANGQNIEQNCKFSEKNRALNGALVLAKAKHKKGGMWHVISSHHLLWCHTLNCSFHFESSAIFTFRYPSPPLVCTKK